MTDEERKTAQEVVEAFDKMLGSQEECGCGRKFRVMFGFAEGTLGRTVARLKRLLEAS